jgi:GNAT superfamily N-acetyltransferase
VSAAGPEPTTIRQAEVTDAPAMGRFMVATWLAAHRDHIPPDVWERRRREWTPEVSAGGWARTLRERDTAGGRTRACFLVAADEDGVIIGLAAGAASGADPAGGLGEVGSLYVDHDHQRRGVGRRLVEDLARCLAGKGIGSLHIGVLTANHDARRFYEALGGQLVEERMFDDEGVLLPESVYAWPDINSLAVRPRQQG